MGTFFGQNSFMLNTAQQNAARSVTITNLVYLEHSDFLEVLKQFPIDYVRIHDKKNIYTLIISQV